MKDEQKSYMRRINQTQHEWRQRQGKIENLELSLQVSVYCS